MHDPTSQGTDFFRCDFCRKPWAEDCPMVEGHRGSLICASCLTVAYTEVGSNDPGLAGSVRETPSAEVCTMCLEHRTDRLWESPLYPARVCRRCVRQSAITLERDPDFEWRRPGGLKPGDERDET